MSLTESYRKTQFPHNPVRNPPKPHNPLHIQSPKDFMALTQKNEYQQNKQKNQYTNPFTWETSSKNPNYTQTLPQNKGKSVKANANYFELTKPKPEKPRKKIIHQRCSSQITPNMNEKELVIIGKTLYQMGQKNLEKFIKKKKDVDAAPSRHINKQFHGLSQVGENLYKFNENALPHSIEFDLKKYQNRPKDREDLLISDSKKIDNFYKVNEEKNKKFNEKFIKEKIRVFPDYNENFKNFYDNGKTIKVNKLNERINEHKHFRNSYTKNLNRSCENVLKDFDTEFKLKNNVTGKITENINKISNVKYNFRDDNKFNATKDNIKSLFSSGCCEDNKVKLTGKVTDNNKKDYEDAALSNINDYLRKINAQKD